MVRSVELKAGFTLVEMVMVLVIIGLLASIIVPQFADQMEDARVAASKANLDNARSAVAIYSKKKGVFPPSIGALTVTAPPEIMNPILRVEPLDGWNKPFLYTPGTGDVKCDSAASPKCLSTW